MIQQRYNSLSQCLDGIQESLEALEIKRIEKEIAAKYCEALLSMIQGQGSQGKTGTDSQEAQQKYLIYLGSLVGILNELYDSLQEDSCQYNQFETDGILDQSLTYDNYMHINRQLIRIRTIVVQMKSIFNKSTEKLSALSMVQTGSLNTIYEAITFVKGCFETWENDSPSKEKNIHEYFNKSKNLNVPHVLFEFIVYQLKQENFEEVRTLSEEFLRFYSDDKGNFRTFSGEGAVDFTSIRDFSDVDVESLHGQYMVALAKLGIIMASLNEQTEASYHRSYTLITELYNSSFREHILFNTWLFALVLKNGKGVSPDSGRALSLFLESARMGYSLSCLSAGEIYAFDEAHQDFEQAQYWLLQAAYQGESEAMSALAQIYAYTEYFDIDKAIFWAHAAHKAGSSDATTLLIRIYVDGLDGRVKPDFIKAEELLKPIAHKDFMYQYYLGFIYTCGGYGLEKCWTLGHQYFASCANAGYADGAYALGCVYADENLVIQPDYQMALKYLEQAEEAGHSNASEKIKELGLR
ncbi:MAG: sel1 repeat family protein [Veillonella sp.]|uniref:tetratricopeptide repeat protein n=1 Tax=Veillonella sp. TaxID=1926307 RepID=UPI0025E9CD3E|nr:tetratricopeptide repeat protein [Veillonella sp.]MBS4912855.1 sel1 repeat family protein [Veillonella sp.]